MTLRRVILEFTGDGIRLRTLYRTSTGANPGTKARRREVEALARTGLERALEALADGETEDLGTSGYSVREDVIGLPLGSPDAQKQVKKGA